MNHIIEELLNGYSNYPVIIAVIIFCLYSIVAPPIIKLIFNKKK